MVLNLKIIGKMKLSNICFFVVFFTSAAFSQVKTTIYPKVIVYDKDTVILFSIEQGKKLAKDNEDRKECFENNEILEKEIQQKDIIISQEQGKAKNYDKIIKDYNEIIKAKDDLKKLCNEEKEILTDEVNKKNRHKWFAIIGGTFTTGFMTYLWIKK
jgi:hypothetical protein